jgi:hypothetical protein
MTRPKMEGGQSHVVYRDEVMADGVVTHSSQNQCIAKKPIILIRIHLHTSIFSDHVEIGERERERATPS